MQPLPQRPFVSFVMATFNRGAVVADCLRHTLTLASLTLGDDRFDIHIVDNASTDQTASILAAFAAEHRHIHLHRLPRNCGPVAKNIALHGNNADLIVLLDDDAYPLPGSLCQMVRHLQDDPQLGAAVFDVTLPDGTKESSAYPDVFIGAGTALRGDALRSLPETGRPGRSLLPADFFMQAEEYDLSWRLLEAGWSVQRFWDMPLMHLKTPGARIGPRTTRLDVRNNLWLLARYLPEPLCTHFAADWLARYWRMAARRDAGAGGSAHRGAFLRGASEGLRHWQRQRGGVFLSAETIEQVFKFDLIRRRLTRLRDERGLQRVVFGDWGKNLLPFYWAATDLGLEITAMLDGNLAGSPEQVEYRGIPVIDESAVAQGQLHADAIIVTAMSRVHAERRAAALRRILQVPIITPLNPMAVPNGRNILTPLSPAL